MTRRGRAHGGLGLGLTAAKATIEAHGGSIEAGTRDEGRAWVRMVIPRTLETA